MNRRTFFKGVAALCCAPIIPFSKRDKLYISPEAIQDIRNWMPDEAQLVEALSIPLREAIFTKENLRIFEKC